MRILWVEDRENQIKHHTSILRKKGHKVTLCSTAEEALGAMLCGNEQGQPHDIVLLDIMLPRGEGSGIDPSTRGELMGEGLLREMKRHQISIPVLCVTAIADAPLIKRLTEYSFVLDVWKKPVAVQDLIDAVSCVPVAGSGGQD